MVTHVTTSAQDTRPGQVRDLRRFWRITLAVILPLGPLYVVAARGLLPYWTDQDTPTMVENSVAHLGALGALNWLGLLGYPLLLVSVMGLAWVTRRAAPALATVGGVLSFLAFVLINASGNLDYLIYIMGREGYSSEQITTLVDQNASHPIAVIGGITFVVGHIVGMILLAIAARRARLLPLWAAVGLAVSQPIHLVAAVIIPSKLLDVTAGWGLTTLGFAMVAWSVLKQSDDEFDLPPSRV
jgi:hypothetical protein